MGATNAERDEGEDGRDMSHYDTSTSPPKFESEEQEVEYVEERARYLKRATRLKSTESLALAYREMGYSRSGIAKRLDITEQTALDYIESISEHYSEDAVESRPQSNPVEELQ